MSDERFDRLLERFDMFDPEFVEHFFEVCSEIRERCPVLHSDAHGEFWTLTRFDDVRNGFGDDEWLSTTPMSMIPPNYNAVPMVPLQTPPEAHGEFRRFLNPHFRTASVAVYEPGIREVIDRVMDEFIEKGHCEFIHDFARRLPGEVILRQVLGFPDVDIETTYGYVLTIMHGLGTPEIETVHRDFKELVAELLERRRREPRRDDVVDTLLHESVLGEPLSDDDILHCIMFLIAAGLDTTAHTLGHMIIRLARDPELRKRLVAEPELRPRAVEEIVRLEPPAGGLVRTAMRDMVIGGQEIKQGERVLLLVAARNRDPREFDHPDEVSIDRDVERNRHLAFGYGARYCIGIHLARLEMRVALDQILDRLEDLRLTDEHIEYDNGVLRGPTHVNIAFTPGAKVGSAASEQGRDQSRP